MSQPFLGEITPVAFNFAPRGWALCNGQILSIQQNTALFALLGTMYGGDGIVNFGLPDLRGRAIVHYGNSPSGTYQQGQPGGVESVTLNISTMPAHSHAPGCVTGQGSTQEPTGNVWAASQTGESLYQTGSATLTSMANGIIGQTGGSQGHSNLQPYLVLNYIIAIQGVFPTRN
jgi:microcystin-dependent protein